jgi:glycosyltransferase involved in cell wall biosynthesis
MRIAQIAPLYESVPPKGYGGTERVVSWLTEELVRMGHDVTLFATGDSETEARLVAGSPRALREMNGYGDALAHHYLLMEKLVQQADQFDIIHAHLDYLLFPFLRSNKLKSVTTLHGRLDLPSLEPLYREFKDIPLVSISETQRLPLSFANWQGNVYHGLPADLYEFNEKPSDYLLFLGRICPDKGVDKAIEIATRAGIHLKIAAKIDPVDVEYFESVIKPLLDQPGVEFLGEAGQSEKNELIGGAKAMLFPILWPEPFGLVMIESMACGTPVIAFNCGSVPEVMEHGVSGYICSTTDEAVEHLKEIDNFNRAGCRAVFDRRFTVSAMAHGYTDVYERILHVDDSRSLLFFGKLRKDVNISHEEREFSIKQA